MKIYKYAQDYMIKSGNPADVYKRQGETVTLVDAAGPGVIQHMWFTGYVGHHFIIRMYWDDQAVSYTHLSKSRRKRGSKMR